MTKAQVLRWLDERKAHEQGRYIDAEEADNPDKMIDAETMEELIDEAIEAIKML